MVKKLQGEDLRTRRQVKDDSGEERDLSLYYAGFNARLFATAIDLVVLFPILMLIAELFPVTTFFNELNHLYVTGQITQEEFAQRFYEMGGSGAAIKASFFSLNSIIQFIIVTALFLLMWMKKYATPGKMLLGMRIVDEATLEHPTNRQLIIRYFAYTVSILPLFVGMIWVAFDKQKQGFHDKLSHTLVLFTEPHDEEWKEKRFRRQTKIALVLLLVIIILWTIR